MKRDCQHGPRDRALKAAFKRLAEMCGGVELSARIAGVSAATISNWGHPNTDVFPPIHSVHALEAVAVDPLVSQLMADFTKVDSGPVEVSSARGWIGGVGVLAQSFGDVSRLVADALGDGTIDAKERLELSRLTAELMTAAQAMHQLAVRAV
jgi:hypothetical protein